MNHIRRALLSARRPVRPTSLALLRCQALMALRDFAQLMKAQGIDANTPPSTFQMMKLAANSEFREAAQKVVSELQKAGVDLTSQDTIQELMGLSRKVGGD
ncbi:hypothetical protein BD769DRAFT_1402715 [Suillus cothurnatus]|nr:hypothetical protein BD769DRAFT_1402715 [Suillus cothurnatus]